jgi:hypothetical protein
MTGIHLVPKDIGEDDLGEVLFLLIAIQAAVCGRISSARTRLTIAGGSSFCSSISDGMGMACL